MIKTNCQHGTVVETYDGWDCEKSHGAPCSQTPSAWQRSEKLTNHGDVVARILIDTKLKAKKRQTTSHIIRSVMVVACLPWPNASRDRRGPTPPAPHLVAGKTKI